MKGGSLLLRVAPVIAYAAFSAVTGVFAIREGFAPVAVALAGSTLVFIVGMVTREADVLYLAWLDQGSNLLLIEVESSAATVLTVTATVVTVLLLADLAHITELFGRRGFGGSIRIFWTQFSRLMLVGAVSGFLAVVGIALSPVITVSSDQVLFVAVLAIGALAAIAIAGTADR